MKVSGKYHAPATLLADVRSGF